MFVLRTQEWRESLKIRLGHGIRRSSHLIVYQLKRGLKLTSLTISQLSGQLDIYCPHITSVYRGELGTTSLLVYHLLGSPGISWYPLVISWYQVILTSTKEAGYNSCCQLRYISE